MVIKTCSFILNGPGFKEKNQFVNGTRTGFDGRYAAISFPSGSTRICAETDEIDRGFWLYAKNWFTKASKTHDIDPRTHIRNVNAGRVGSSVGGTVSLTCSIGLSLSSSPACIE